MTETDRDAETRGMLAMLSDAVATHVQGEAFEQYRGRVSATLRTIVAVLESQQKAIEGMRVKGINGGTF